MCVSPYIATRNDGQLVPVPCGKCIECLRDYQNDWAFRLTQECRRVTCPIKVELTYRPADLPVGYNEELGEWQSYVKKRDVQLFLKRLRKACPEFKNNLRYFAIGEYGENNRAHYHIILMSPSILYPFQYYTKLLNAWGHGFIYVKRALPEQIGYVTKYLNKIDLSPHITKPFKLMSKQLGLCYLTDRMVDYFFSTFATGVPWKNSYIKLPRYYRKKLDQYAEKYGTGNYGYDKAGMNFSDVVRLRKFEPKGLAVHFDDFCNNFDKHYAAVRAHELNKALMQGYQPPDLSNISPNTVFRYFCDMVRDIKVAIYDSRRRIRDAQIKHYTKLYPSDLEKVMPPAPSLAI